MCSLQCMIYFAVFYSVFMCTNYKIIDIWLYGLADYFLYLISILLIISNIAVLNIKVYINCTKITPTINRLDICKNFLIWRPNFNKVNQSDQASTNRKGRLFTFMVCKIDIWIRIYTKHAKLKFKWLELLRHQTEKLINILVS